MKTIKFRGKSVVDGKWVYGLFCREKVGNLIVPCIQQEKECDSRDYIVIVEVDGNTIGQYSGLKDKNGKEIYDGDILRDADTGNIKQMIFNAPSFVLKDSKGFFYWTYHADEYEIIGNICENDELPEVSNVSNT